MECGHSRVAHEEGKSLDELVDKLKGPMIGMRLDILRAVMDDLEANEKLKEIFGSPVCAKLGVIAEVNDLRITELKLIELSEEQENVFLGELEPILQKRIKEAGI
ncbi:MAG: hypothetical protein ABH851_09615 [Methanobacteriota archaeon]